MHAAGLPSPDYSRQRVLPEVGDAGQARLRAARVLVVGAGGLGAPLLGYLAGAGIGTLGVLDGDVLDASNLHRRRSTRSPTSASPRRCSPPSDCAP